MELGTFSKRILLTGAGFSRNWGGYTSGEMWARVKGEASVRQNEELNRFLVTETSFEVALAKARAGEVSADSAQTLESAILKAFESLDRQLLSAPKSGPTSINIDGVQKFLSRFYWKSPDNTPVDTGYIFTLNQDLWLERFLYNTDVYHAGDPALSGMEVVRNGRLATSRPWVRRRSGLVKTSSAGTLDWKS